ncbi:hypothetical protein RPMA_02325 [Tardiphaga alba]|uniref:GIY-YIG nuclease family protein n=1 Tax=Tardiphaga alba TaxID=340268 RepID=A0ABX8A354_9BRAD|nr:hypothetical protein [Tardiphaga alba]QUS37827.1 hypothetical protein RPMA_02325 [Tardiphaga alba]
MIKDLHLPVTPSTTIIHRPFGGVTAYRCLSDRASRVCVHAFPMKDLPQVSAAGLLGTAGAYVITDHRTAYVGESGRPIRRLGEHACDPGKSAFAREAFVVTGVDGCAFDKGVAVDLQFRLTRAAIDASVVAVSKGASPVEPVLTAADRATHDRIVDDALRLLNDAGCRIFQPGPGTPPEAEEPVPTDEGSDPADSGPMEIDVGTVPAGTEVYELTYDDAWARGYWSGSHFVVAAGSEMRTTTNGSVNQITRTRREDLFRAGVLSAIPGVSGRRRLMVAIAFSTQSIAAKVLCGAHTAGRWTPLKSKSVWLAA